MKKLTLIVLMASLCYVVNAQEVATNKGIILGGSMNFFIQNNTYPLSSLSITSGVGGVYSNSTNDTKNMTFAITPYIGKEINQKLFVGLQLDYRIGKYKAEDAFLFGVPSSVDFERNSNQFGVGLFTRHVLNPSNQFNFFVQPYLEYNLLKEEEVQDSNITQEEKASYVELGVDLGVVYNVNNKIRVTLRTGGISYINGKWEIIDTDVGKDFSSFGANLNLSTIFFGAEIKI